MKIVAITFLIFLNALFSFGCTTFVLKNDSTLVFGRNLDWVSDNGVIVVNTRNVTKKSLVFSPEKATHWTSKYGSVTFNQFGKEFPFGGINEKGLVVEIMLVAGEYPKFDDRTAINELQWVQYQLDNSKTIEDVIASDSTIRISIIDRNLHFLVCDSSGNVAVIEFDENGIIVHRGNDLPVPVLENEPYEKSLQKSKHNQKCRFGTVAKMLNTYAAKPTVSAIDYSFSILDKVALDGSWSIVYDIKNMEILFKTSSYKTIRKIQINDFNFSCQEGSKLYDLEREDNAYINEYFVDFSAELNKKKFLDGIVTNDIALPKEIFMQFYAYYETCQCPIKPELIEVTLSECKENCTLAPGLISSTLQNDTLAIEIGVVFSCCGNFKGSFDYWASDTLNLTIHNQPNEKGLTNICLCNCYYKVKYTISNVQSLPPTILFNGATFQENKKKAYWLD